MGFEVYLINLNLLANLVPGFFKFRLIGHFPHLICPGIN